MKILIHAMMYPEGPKELRANTSLFLHEYAQRWVRSGHDVLVFHHKMAYPAWMEKVARALARAVPRLTFLREFLNGYGSDEDAQFARDGVCVLRRNLPRWLPRSLISARAKNKRAQWVRAELEKRAFQPDLVIADFLCPSAQIALAGKERGGAPVALILHDTCMGYLRRPWTRARAEALARNVDFLVFRSESAKRAFENSHFVPARAVLMPSGVPEELAAPLAAPREQVRNYLYVGRLIARKYLLETVEAFGQANCSGAQLTIVGDGPERDAIAQAIARQPNANSIHMLGPLAHADVFRAMEAADAFVMISEKETFGMVYVEAMSRGAIPIGSRGEGIDGVVREGQNGFLLPAGDKDALARLFERLHAMPAEEVRALSQNAWESVEALRADKLAESVLASLRVRETPRSLVFFTRGYPTPGMPSHQVFVARLARAMADCGADVRVIYPVARHRRRREKAPFLFTERTEQGNRVEVFCPSRANLLWYPLTAWRFERAALREMRRRGLCPDAIYAHFAVPPGTAAARAGKKLGIPAFFAYGESTPKLLKQYGARRAARTLQSVSGVIAVSTDAAHTVGTYGLARPERVRVFPNGVDAKRFHPMDRETCRAAWGIPQSAFVLAFVGAFSARKGAARASEAIARAGNAFGIFAGSGEETPIGPHILFAGAVEPARMAEFLNAADAFLLPTRNEGCCNALVEAMACGLPLITSDRDFNRDIAGEDNALLIEPDDVDAIARAIGALRDDPERRQAMGAHSLERAKSLTLSARAEAILAFMREQSGT